METLISKLNLLILSSSLLILILSFQYIPTVQSKFSGLGVRRTRAGDSIPPRQSGLEAEDESTGDADYEMYYYNQTLDHFSYKPESHLTTFRQRYVVNSKYWGGASTTSSTHSSPIFVYFGHEGSIDSAWTYIGFLTENAPRFKALLLYIEHRYYGESIPFGSWKEASANASTLGYLNSAQAIADYAAVILHVKQTYSAKNSPVIVVGGSYSGMLASWFRLKYPHIAVGALASSAPILYFDGGVAPGDGYYSIVTKDFKEASESCYEAISKSWVEIERVASKPNGLSFLSKKFKTCRRSFDLKDYLDSIYADAAQYNEPPEYPVGKVCRAIDGAAGGEGDLLGQILAGVVAYMGNRSCYDVVEFSRPTASSRAWSWQMCSELVFPIGHESNDTMFPPEPFSLNSFTKGCNASFGILPHPHWIPTFYGGHDLKLALHRFASNIIFSNGLRDPYSSGGVLENISDSIIAVSTTHGSHCLDIMTSRPSDPDWLIEQRKTELEIIGRWLSKYYTDLVQLK